VPAAARDFSMRLAGGARLLAHYDWLYGFDGGARDILQRDGLRSAFLQRPAADVRRS
jgi:hypothetical protein